MKTIFTFGILLIGVIASFQLQAQNYSTNGGTVNWTQSGTGFSEATLYTTGTGTTHGDAFDGVLATTVSGTNISFTTSLHFSSTYATAIQQVVVTNSGSSSSTYTLSITGNLGSDGNTYWHYANASTCRFTISSDQSSASLNGSDPVVSFIYGSNNGYGTSSISYSNGSDAQSYTISSAPIAAGETHRYLFIVGVGDIDDQYYNRPDQAYSAVSNLLNPTNWPSDFTSFLNAAQKAQVKNWTIKSGENCSDAINLSYFTSGSSGSFSGTTVGYADDISTCKTGGPDRIFYLSVPNNYQIEIYESVNSYDEYEYLGYGSSCPGSQLYCHDNDALSHMTWTNTTGSAQTVWYIQDAYSNGSGTFTLNWTLTSVAVTPGTPTTLTSSVTGTTTANISWAAGSPTGTPAPTYYWAVKNSGGTTITSGNTTSTSASVTGLSSNTNYYFTVYASNSGGSSGTATSGTFLTYPADPTSISGASSPSCSGNLVTLTANGAVGTVYWYKDGCGSTYLGTGNSINVSPTATTTYYIKNHNGTNYSSGCASATLTINIAPSISSHPSTSSQSICLNGSATALSVSASGTSLSYLWYSNTSASTSGGSSISGATSSSYTPPTSASGTKYYYCVVSGTCTPSVTSNVSGAITVAPTSVAGTASGSSSSVCSGTNSTTLTLSGYSGTIQWQYSTNNSTFSNISGATSSSYNATNLTATRYYRAIVTSSPCSNATSNTVTITVNTAPSISTHPSTATQSICRNGSATALSVTASGTSLSYQWYSNTSASTTGGSSISGATSSSYTPPTSASGTKYYYCIVSGTCTPSVTSNVSGAITVAPTSVAGTASGSASVCSGTNSTTISLSGYTGTIQWQYSTNNSTFSNISGATSSSYNATNLTVTRYYRAIVTSSPCSNATSNTVTITVNTAPSISTHPSTATQSICRNGSATALSVTASGTSLSYQWYSNTSASTSGGSSISGATSSSYTPPTSASGTKYYYCIVSGTCTPSVTSNVSGAITVAPTSVAGTASGSASVCSGTNSTTLTLSGYTGTIQWQISTDNSSFSNISGATSSTYTASNLTATRYYRAIVTSSPCSNATSNTVTITVNSLPTVSAITGTTSICSGLTSQLSSTPSGGTWSSGSTSVATINSSGLVTGVAAGSSSITYSYTDGNGCSNSASTTVSITSSLSAPTSVTATPSSIQSGQSSTLNATTTGNSIYWYDAASGGSPLFYSASGANYSVSPSSTTTYYAESRASESFYVNSLLHTGSSTTDHNSYTGDDRGGIAISSSYIYVVGDGNTVRYTMPNFTSPTSYVKRDGIFSDLKTGQLYTLWNGTSNPIYGNNTSTYSLTAVRTLTDDLNYGSTTLTLSSTISLTGGKVGIYSGYGFLILQNNTNFYKIDLTTGAVTNIGTYTISRYWSESWAIWGVAEYSGTAYSILYRAASSNNINRLNLSTGAVTTAASFNNLGDMASFTYSPTYNRWYYHYESSAQFGSNYETVGYATGSHSITSASCPSNSRTSVTVTIANPPTLTTTSISNINSTSATSGGNITDGGASSVTERGVCWSTSQNPTTSNSKTTDGTGDGSFTSSITGLTAGTTYYVRAYATNSIGTSYGTQVTFTTYAPGSISGNQTICSGSTPAQLTSSAAATAMPSVTYQWQSSTDNISFSNISGATSTAYQPGSVSQVTYFKRNAISGAVTLSSNTVTVSMSAGEAAPTSVSATPSTILSGASSNITATVTTGNEVKWYDASTGGSVLTTVASATNYTVTPSTTTTYYAQTSPIACTKNTLENILANFNSNYANITNQIPSPYNFSLDAGASSYYIADGGSDMYDHGNYLSTNISSNFYYSDNSILNTSIFGTSSKYFTRKVNNMFVLAADLTGASWFKINGDYGSDGGGSTNTSEFTVTVGCTTFKCFISRVYNASDPSINELIIVPTSTSVTQSGIKNTSNSYHTINGIQNSDRLYYILYAGSSGSYISDAYAQNIATAFLTQTQAVITGSSGCPSSSRTPVSVTVSSIPTISATAVSTVTTTTASSGGTISSDGGSTITAKGVCWSTSHNPTTSSSKTTDGTGTSSFTSSITGLSANTTYYLRAYATNSMGTSYSSEISFTTPQYGTFANINKTYGDPDFVLVNPSSSSPGAFLYSSDNTGVATISGNTVHIVGAGTANITATQSATSVYAQKTWTAELNVSKSNQTISLNIPTSAPLNTFIGTSIIVSATSTSGLAVTLAIDAASTASATLNLVNGDYYLSNVSSSGSIVIEATQSGNSNYFNETTSSSFDVTKGNQEITFNSLNAKTYGDASFSVSASGGSSGNPVVFTSLNSNIATCSGTNGEIVTIVGAGSCQIVANQAGNSSWNAANPVSQTLVVNKATPTISNFANISKTYGDADFSFSAASNSSGAVSYSSSNSSVLSLTFNTASITGAGSSTVTASVAADANYIAATEDITVTVNKATQTITLSPISDINLIDYVGNPISPGATSSSGLAITYSLGASSPATVDGQTIVSDSTTGTVMIYANQAGNDNYEAATQVIDAFDVTAANQTITFGSLSTVYLGDADFDLTATASSSLLVSYTSSNTNVATINGKTVTIVGVGTTTFTATQGGNTYYSAATPVQQTLEVQYPVPTITSFTPTSAGQADNVSIVGTNFTGATAVTFGNTSATSFTVVDDENITATVASGTSGDVEVTGPGGTGSLSGFTFIDAPTITSFSPTYGASGSTITITGTNLTTASQVSFGGISAVSFTVLNATTIEAVVGSGSSGIVEVSTTGGDASKSGFTFYETPTTQASDIVFSAVTDNTMNISWTNGNGSKRIVFMKNDNTGSASPSNATTYTANTVFESGSQIGTSGWYCIYNGTSNSVSVSELDANSNYIVHVMEYNGVAGIEQYNTTDAANNPKTQTTIAPVIVTNLNQTNTNTNTASPIIIRAQAFVNGNSERQLEYVTFSISSGLAADALIFLYTRAANGDIGSLITDFNSGIYISGNQYKFSPTAPTLFTPNTSYWFIMKTADDAKGTVGFDYTTNQAYVGYGAIPSTDATGTSNDGGTTYDYDDLTDGSYLFEVNGNEFSTLPVSFYSLSVSCNSIDWSTASEVNNAYFEILTSDDLVRWSPIAQVAGSGNSNQLVNYTYILDDSETGLYYRIRQVDFDGQFSYSRIATKECNQDYEVDIQVFPNPTENLVNLVFDNSFNRAKVEIYNYLGELVLYKELSENVSTIDVSNFSTGVYFLRISLDGNLQKELKLIKQ
jgi:hypothetical protein